MALEKGVVSLVLLVPGWSKLQEVLLSCIANPQLELALVMLIVPFVVHAVMFWVVDSLTMRKYNTMKSLEGKWGASKTRAESLPPTGGSSEESQALLTADAASEEEEDEERRVSVQISGGPLRPSLVVV